MNAAAVARAQACYLRACALDVAVRKPGNVSHASPGHRMQAAMFIASARASAGPLFEPGARVGARIEAAVEASWAAAGCNTNLGILLLCAPIARAVERCPQAVGRDALRAAIDDVLGDLDRPDAEAAYRAIARARPGGLGTAASQDVHAPPSIDLRAAMALAAARDRIARQYRDGYADLFELGLAALGGGLLPAAAAPADELSREPPSATVAAVQRLYLALLAGFPDSHIVRKHGEAVAHSVMTAAQGWRARADAGTPAADAEFAAWDDALKAAQINPGTTADLTVGTLLIAGLIAPDHAAPAA
jgi:triphosphoribosyl-dephospho-CoA synthase